MILDIFLKPNEGLLPPIGMRIPRPTAHPFESALAIDVKSSFLVLAALTANPHPQSVAIDLVGLWHAGVTMVLNVFAETLETILPLVGK